MSTLTPDIEKLRNDEQALFLDLDASDSEPPFVTAFLKARQAREEAEEEPVAANSQSDRPMGDE